MAVNTQHPSILWGARIGSSFCNAFLRQLPARRRGPEFDPVALSAARMPDILLTMAGNLFDVFVVGATDPSPAGETRLAAALSARHGVPLATVAKAISAKNLRAGQGLEQPQAQALVRHLQSIGAVTVIRPSAARGQAGAATAPQAPRPPSPQGSAGPVFPQAPGRVSNSMPAVGGGWPGSSAAVPGNQAADPFSQLPPPQAVGVSPAISDPFQPRGGGGTPTAIPRGRQNSPTPAPARPSGSGQAVEVSPGPKLELARARAGDDEDDRSSARSRAGATATSLREVGMGGKSGVVMDEDPRNLNLVRCVQHGLYYDKTKASGCRKCMSPAREVAQKMTAESAAPLVSGLRSSPAKRAFLGLALSLVLGFLPAVYYCFGPGAAEVRKLRVEQEVLSRQPGTDEIIKRFDELNGQVIVMHETATRNTAIVWFAVASVSMLAWYSIT